MGTCTYLAFSAIQFLEKILIKVFLPLEKDEGKGRGTVAAGW